MAEKCDERYVMIVANTVLYSMKETFLFLKDEFCFSIHCKFINLFRLKLINVYNYFLPFERVKFLLLFSQEKQEGVEVYI